MSSALRRGLVGLSWIVLAACGGKASPGFTEGTRLKAVYLEAEGAPPLFLRWYDTELGFDCMFADVGLADRVVCFPTNPVDSPLLVFATEGSISTDSCTEPFVPLTCNPRFFARAPKRGEPCGTPVHLFPLGAACQAATDMNPAAPFRLGPELPLETLVSGTYRPGTGPGRIVPLTIVASDGSIQRVGTTGRFQGDFGGEVYPAVLTEWVAWDKERNEMVSASYGGDLATRWHPLVDYGVSAEFADAACSVPVALASACPVRATEAFRWDGGMEGCGRFDLTNFVQLGSPGPVGATSYHQSSPGDACQSDLDFSTLGIDPMSAAFPLGASIPATSFAEAVEVRTGTKQLQLLQAGSADGPATTSYPWGFFDTVHEQTCNGLPGQQAADGTLRCLPLSNIRFLDTRVFADAACTVPLVTLDPAGACAPKQRFFVSTEIVPTGADSATPGCGVTSIQRWHFHPVGDHYTGAVYSSLPAGHCLPVESTASPGQGPQEPYYEVGPEIPPGDFAKVKYVHPS